MYRTAQINLKYEDLGRYQSSGFETPTYPKVVFWVGVGLEELVKFLFIICCVLATCGYPSLVFNMNGNINNSLVLGFQNIFWSLGKGRPGLIVNLVEPSRFQNRTRHDPNGDTLFGRYLLLEE